MTCEDVRRSVLEQGGDGDEATAHRSSCEDCAALWRTHVALGALGPSRAVRSVGPAPSLRGAVARRRRERTVQIGVVAGALAAAVLAVAWARAPGPVEDVAPLVASAADHPEDLLASLVGAEELAELWARDVTRLDESYAPFGELAVWLSPAGEQELMQWDHFEQFEQEEVGQ